VGDDSHLVFGQKLLGEDGSVRQGVFMVKHPGLFSPKLGVPSSHVFTQLPQNVAVEPGIHSLSYWDRCFALPQLLYRWRHQSEIFWIPPHTNFSVTRSPVEISDTSSLWCRSAKRVTFIHLSSAFPLCF
jgi:hypothetical protein